MLVVVGMAVAVELAVAVTPLGLCEGLQQTSVSYQQLYFIPTFHSFLNLCSYRNALRYSRSSASSGNCF